MSRFEGFPSTGLIWGESRGFEPFGVARGTSRVPRFRRHRILATRKSPEFPGRNAKTCWVEPAGLERNGHLAVNKFMEAVSWTRKGATFFEIP
jgi:hypothetical protein